MLQTLDAINGVGPSTTASRKRAREEGIDDGDEVGLAASNQDPSDSLPAASTAASAGAGATVSRAASAVSAVSGSSEQAGITAFLTGGQLGAMQIGTPLLLSINEVWTMNVDNLLVESRK
mmetsp:Transcript_23861/g.49273  ORF Transcript_23861/g.49273 Transcript_23861/m.49273 type:complete len:120 (-) Transcript_23861:654-1013(-)